MMKDSNTDPNPCPSSKPPTHKLISIIIIFFLDQYESKEEYYCEITEIGLALQGQACIVSSGNAEFWFASLSRIP